MVSPPKRSFRRLVLLYVIFSPWLSMSICSTRFQPIEIADVILSETVEFTQVKTTVKFQSVSNYDKMNTCVDRAVNDKSAYYSDSMNCSPSQKTCEKFVLTQSSSRFFRRSHCQEFVIIMPESQSRKSAQEIVFITEHAVHSNALITLIQGHRPFL
jgi:hypothetical protein